MNFFTNKFFKRGGSRNLSPMMALFGVLTVAVIAISACSEAEAQADKKVNLLSLGNLHVPVKGAMSYSYTMDTEQWTAVVSWTTSTGIPVSGNFEAATVYMAQLDLSAKKGWTFKKLEQNAFYHYGATSVTNGAGTGKTINVTVRFPATAPLDNAEAPVISAQPESAVYLKDAEPLALSVSASVTDGGTLSYQWFSNSTNTYTGGTAIAGATSATYTPATAEAGTLYYYVEVSNTNLALDGEKVAVTRSVLVSVTVELTVSLVSLDGLVIGPEKHAVPSTGAIDTEYYTGTLSWQTASGEPVTGNFEPATSYKAVLELEAKSGWSFEGLAQNTFSYSGASSVTNTIGNKTITVVIIFPATAGLVAAEAPVILTQPQGAHYQQNGTASALSVSASVTDGGTLSYQWFSNSTNSYGGTAITGATSASYLPSTATVGTVYYYVELSNTNASVDGVQSAVVCSSIVSVQVDLTLVEGVQVNFVLPADETVDLSLSGTTLSWLDNEALTITVNGTVSEWLVDGAKVSGGTYADGVSSLVLRAGSFTLSKHRVSAKVTINGVSYSKTVYFTVE